MELRGSGDSGGVPMAATLPVVVVEETRQASSSDTVDFEVGSSYIQMQMQMQISTAAATHKDSTEKTALAVAATAAVDLTNLFFLLRGDTDTERRRRWGWTGGISVLFAFAALLSATGIVLALHTTVVVSAARRRLILVASAAALFVASAGTVLALVDAQGCAMSCRL